MNAPVEKAICAFGKNKKLNQMRLAQRPRELLDANCRCWQLQGKELTTRKSAIS
jgi:hypothetical protein